MAAVWDARDAGDDAPGARFDTLFAAVGAANAWTESTVRTLVHRLGRKGALRSERVRDSVVYRPTIRREDWVTSESQGLLDRLFGGQVAPLVAHFTQQRAISAEDLARLKKLVAELDRAAEDEEG